MVNRILVVNVNWLGDVIFSIPIFKALRKKFPQAKISCMAVPRVKDILESCSYLDEVIVYDEDKTHRGLVAKGRFVVNLRKKKFDMVFLLHRSFTRALLVFWAGIPQRIGYVLKNRGILLTDKIKEAQKNIHRSDYYSYILESFNIPVEDKTCDLSISQTDYEAMAHRLSSAGIKRGDFLIVIHVGGNWDLKRWPKENFSLLIKQLMTELNAKVIISGSKSDKGLAEEIVRNSDQNPIIWAGDTTLKQLMALMKFADVVVSSDSGPMHVAVGVGTKIIALFGPTRPEITGPRGNSETYILQKDVGCNRHPCYFLTCPSNVCMQAISVDDVMGSIKQIRNQKNFS